MVESNKKPRVGFFPCFTGLGEGFPSVKIAKRYIEFGGEVVFFSHGGEYEYMAEEIGCDVIRIEPIASGGTITKYFLQKSAQELADIVKNEAKLLKESDIKALVQSNVYFDAVLAPRLAKIPLITLVSGVGTPPFYEANMASFPDDLENLFTRFIPQSLKNRVFNWISLNSKNIIPKKFNQIAKKLGLNINFKRTIDMIPGDHTFVCDDMDFLGLNPTRDFPAENYIGPILPYDIDAIKTNPLDVEIENHFKRPGKSILLTMGSSIIMKKIFLRILKILNQSDYNVVATYTDILKENELPQLGENIILKKFIPNINSLFSKVDLAVIHGGRGTVHTVAYAGKPVIGIPVKDELQWNFDNLVRHNMALRL